LWRGGSNRETKGTRRLAVAKKAIYLGQVEAADAETAIKRAIEKYDIAVERRDRRGSADHAGEPAMIIEGRTIKTIEEMQEFCEAAVAASHADPSALRLHVPQDMRVAEITLPDGRRSTMCRSRPPPKCRSTSDQSPHTIPTGNGLCLPTITSSF
jgi:hypothetical protein